MLVAVWVDGGWTLVRECVNVNNDDPRLTRYAGLRITGRPRLNGGGHNGTGGNVPMRGDLTYGSFQALYESNHALFRREWARVNPLSGDRSVQGVEHAVPVPSS